MEFSLVAACEFYVSIIHSHLSCSRGRAIPLPQPALFPKLPNPFPPASSHTSWAAVPSHSVQCDGTQRLPRKALWWGHLRTCCWRLKSHLFVASSGVVLTPFFFFFFVYKGTLGRSWGAVLGCEAMTWQVAPLVFMFTLQPQDTVKSTSPVSEGCPNQSLCWAQHPALQISVCHLLNTTGGWFDIA